MLRHCSSGGLHVCLGGRGGGHRLLQYAELRCANRASTHAALSQTSQRVTRQQVAMRTSARVFQCTPHLSSLRLEHTRMARSAAGAPHC